MQWIENVGMEIVAISGAPATPEKAPTMAAKTFFSTLLDTIARLCARVRIAAGATNNNNNNSNSNSDGKQQKQQAGPANASFVDRVATLSNAVALCREFSRLLVDLLRFAQAELQKPLIDRRPDANLFLKDEVKRRIAALVVAPLCFFEYSSLHESFSGGGGAPAALPASLPSCGFDSDPRLMMYGGSHRGPSSAVLDAAVAAHVSATARGSGGGGGGGGGANNNSTSSKRGGAIDSMKSIPSNSSFGGASQQHNSPHSAHSTESAEDVAFASAARSTAKLLKSLKIFNWQLAAVLIYSLHRRSSLSKSMLLLDAFRGLTETPSVAVASAMHGYDASAASAAASSNNNAGPSSSSSSSATAVIAGDYLRRKPLPGCEPLITRSSRHHPVPNLMSCAMLIARRILRPGVPFFGAQVGDAQEDAIDKEQHHAAAASPNLASPSGQKTSAQKMSTSSNIDLANLSRNIEKCLVSGDGRISDYFPQVPDLFRGGNSSFTTSSLVMSRTAQALTAAKEAEKEKDNLPEYEYGAVRGDDAESWSTSLRSALSMFEACSSEPDSMFMDYAVHTVLTMVYLPFMHVALPTKATLVASSQLSWDVGFDHQWIEWAVTCPRLREDVYNVLSKVMKPGAPPIQKRMPTGSSMSAVLCDQILPYLVQLRGDPRANLSLCPVMMNGKIASSSSSSPAAASPAAAAAAAAAAAPSSSCSSRLLNHREIDILLTRRYCWCLHVFFFEHAAAIARANNTSPAAAGQIAYVETNISSSSKSSKRSNISPDSKKEDSPLPSQLQLQKKLRQIDIWVDELIVGLKTFFVNDQQLYAVLLRGVAELSNAFHHGRALVEVDGFNPIVDKAVAQGDVGALLPILQTMGSSLTSREWNYVLLVSKGAGLLRDALHLAIALSSDIGKVKGLVWQAFPSLRLSSHSVPNDPQLADAVDMLQKLGAG